jgi:NaMN:DMB phosphoribosyltransferase
LVYYSFRKGREGGIRERRGEEGWSGDGVVNREISVHLVEQVECRVKEDPACKASALELVFALMDRAVAVVGGVVTAAGGAAWREVLATLAGCTLGFRSGAGTSICVVRL